MISEGQWRALEELANATRGERRTSEELRMQVRRGLEALEKEIMADRDPA